MERKHLNLHIDNSLINDANYGPCAALKTWQVPMVRKILLFLVLFQPKQVDWSVRWNDVGYMADKEDTATDIYIRKADWEGAQPNLDGKGMITNFLQMYSNLLGVNYNHGYPIRYDSKTVDILLKFLSADNIRNVFFDYLLPAGDEDECDMQDYNVVEQVFNMMLESTAQRLRILFLKLFDSKFQPEGYQLYCNTEYADKPDCAAD